ncbi:MULTISPECIES: translation initiation factor IF-3 [Desulfolutivibrio]|uniref:Translation initiation factor IF-3 n=1 Tax=Desulfolutivibrio sulfodismutans TaxID=63561 RepID=A0A7K3NJ30_9BACT|nr:translation initiation factor IF-3 [Desulfolutivibrio sulfodismutans]NDY56204.1 translation initiation factor IF-3 [Desulfolutivibrio sulfodismutans]QLA12364.1 translation initiation factor IF-3 [Desulfolutivibrio sulfodismutans DSM 3696]
MNSAPSEPRCNHRIRAREVRVIADDGQQLGIIPTSEALRIAQEKGLDLVEVASGAEPPVCRIMDFGKFKYQQQKKQQEARKKQTVIQLKEIKVRPKTDEHDYLTKLKHIRRFLEAGDRCKVTVFFRGREIVHKDRGLTILNRIVVDLGELAKTEQEPKSEGRTMTMLLAPQPKK